MYHERIRRAEKVHRLLLLQQCMVSRPGASTTGAASVDKRIAFSPEALDAVINQEPDDGVDCCSRMWDSDLAQHRLHDAEDLRVVTEDRCVLGVVRHQPHVTVALLERLDGRFLAIDERGHDVAVLGSRL